MASTFTRRTAATLLSSLLWVTGSPASFAQSTAATPAPAAADPKTRVPAEIVPGSNGSNTKPGAAAREVTTPSSPLSPGSKAAVESDSPSARSTVDALSDPDLDEILSVLKARYVTPAALSDAELKRATIQGLLERLNASVSLEPKPTPGNRTAESPAPFRGEILNNKIGYLRLGVLNSANLSHLDKALAQFSQEEVAAEILDLRAVPAGTDFEAAAEICRRWCAKGKPLFTVRRPGTGEQTYASKADPTGRGMLVVLTSVNNAGSAEIIAGTLRASARALIVGQKTKGAAAESADVPLASGKRLRFAIAEVRLPSGQPIGPTGVAPDLAVSVAPAATEEVLRLALAEGGAAALLTETERPRLNEAALVAGRNPEVDAIEASQRTHGTAKPPLRDIVLQRAVDLITSVEVFERKPAR